MCRYEIIMFLQKNSEAGRVMNASYFRVSHILSRQIKETKTLFIAADIEQRLRKSLKTFRLF